MANNEQQQRQQYEAAWDQDRLQQQEQDRVNNLAYTQEQLAEATRERDEAAAWIHLDAASPRNRRQHSVHELRRVGIDRRIQTRFPEPGVSIDVERLSGKRRCVSASVHEASSAGNLRRLTGLKASLVRIPFQQTD